MIEKIILKIGQKTIKLTDSEARQVWADLNPRYGQQPIYPPLPASPSIPYYPRFYPTWECKADTYKDTYIDTYTGKIT